MLYVNSINIVHSSKKERWKRAHLAKLYIRENKILLSTSGGAICRQTRQYANFIHKCLFDVTNSSLIVPRSKLVRSEINQKFNKHWMRNSISPFYDVYNCL